jgi:uncharacterized membrane protein YccC
MPSTDAVRLDARAWVSRARLVVTGWARATRNAVTRPGVERAEGLLLLKAAVATVLAWQLAVHLLGSDQPFYAPMAALLVVDRTMVRSIGASARRVAAVVLGMSIAWLVGSLVGVTSWSMVVVMFVALLIGRWERLGDHGIQVPAMVLLSLITVNGTDTQFTALTIVETVLGGVVGVAVNAVVLAPMHLDEPRDALRDLTRRVQDVLAEISTGLRGEWDTDGARRWYDAATDLGGRVPEVLAAVETGRESTRYNWRHRLRPARIDWDGYATTVEAVRRAQWQVAGIARTLVDAADEEDLHPAPSPAWLRRYAQVLDGLGRALAHFGVGSDEARDAVRREVRGAREALDRLGEEVRTTPLDDPHAWPAYGALLLEAGRLARELGETNAEASVPTDSGPLRAPLTETVPAVGHLQQQVPVVAEQLPRILGQVSGLGRREQDRPPAPESRPPGPTGPDAPAGRGAAPRS